MTLQNDPGAFRFSLSSFPFSILHLLLHNTLSSLPPPSTPCFFSPVGTEVAPVCAGCRGNHLVLLSLSAGCLSVGAGWLPPPACLPGCSSQLIREATIHQDLSASTEMQWLVTHTLAWVFTMVLLQAFQWYSCLGTGADVLLA